MNTNDHTPGTLLWAILAVLVLVTVFLGALFTLGWNLGFVALLGAVGVSASGLSVFEGMGVVLTLLIVAMIFRTSVTRTS